MKVNQTEIVIPIAETVPISALKVDGQNPNKMTREQLNHLKTSIQQFGFIVPIITNKDLLIADGEQHLLSSPSPIKFMVTIKCVTCGKEFEVVPARANTAKCCSRQCQSTYFKTSGMYKAENNPMYGKKRLDLSATNKTPEHIAVVANFHRGKKRSEETRKRIGIKSKEAHLKHPRWKGNDNPWALPNNPKQHYYLSETLHQKTLERFNYTCQKCGSKENSETHHIMPRRLGGTDNDSNLTVLCHKCHREVDYAIVQREREHWEKYTGQKRNLIKSD